MSTETAVRERPIIFSAPMVRAILSGAKTQTRRVVKGVALDALAPSMFTPKFVASPENTYCPYGVPGDRLWVRETCRAEELSSGLDGVRYLADNTFREIENSERAANSWIALNCYHGVRGAKVPSIFMPRWASRITLEITEVRAQRLQEISKSDCIAEGMDGLEDVHAGWHQPYAQLWDSINGKRPGCSWNDNPWVWALTFRRVDGAQ